MGQVGEKTTESRIDAMLISLRVFSQLFDPIELTRRLFVLTGDSGYDFDRLYSILDRV